MTNCIVIGLIDLKFKDGMQAQKIFGNRWTEIAKVVSGRYTEL